MVIFKNTKYGVKFQAPDLGGGSAPGPANPAAGQGGTPEGSPSSGSGTTSTEDPFKDVDLDDLDPATRKIVEGAKAQFAATQKALLDERNARERNERLAREFQAKHDKLANQVRGLNGQDPSQVNDPRAKLLSDFERQLEARGVPEAGRRVQAELMLEMMDAHGKQLREEIGRELAPLASTVITQEANNAWYAAMAEDKFGALQIPEVAQKTWDTITELVQSGQPVNKTTVQNLTRMNFMEHCETTGQFPTQLPPNMPPTPPTGMVSNYPNMAPVRYSGASPYRPTPPDPNAPKYQLDPATKAAIDRVTSTWKQGLPKK